MTRTYFAPGGPLRRSTVVRSGEIGQPEDWSAAVGIASHAVPALRSASTSAGGSDTGWLSPLGPRAVVPGAAASPALSGNGVITGSAHLAQHAARPRLVSESSACQGLELIEIEAHHADAQPSAALDENVASASAVDHRDDLAEHLVRWRQHPDAKEGREVESFRVFWGHDPRVQPRASTSHQRPSNRVTAPLRVIRGPATRRLFEFRGTSLNSNCPIAPAPSPLRPAQGRQGVRR
jgi:hypothetical protein